MVNIHLILTNYCYQIIEINRAGRIGQTQSFPDKIFCYFSDVSRAIILKISFSAHGSIFPVLTLCIVFFKCYFRHMNPFSFLNQVIFWGSVKNFPPVSSISARQSTAQVGFVCGGLPSISIAIFSTIAVTIDSII